MAVSIDIVDPKRATSKVDVLAIVGRKASLTRKDVLALVPSELQPAWKEMVASLKGGDAGKSASTWNAGGKPQRLIAAVLPEACSRHNSGARPHAITDLTKGLGGSGKKVGIVLALESKDYAFASVCAVARAFPLFSTKQESSKGKGKGGVLVACTAPDGKISGKARMKSAIAGVRLAARLVDTPTSVLHTDQFVEEAKAVADKLGIKPKIIRGQQLVKKKMGGMWGVGKAAARPPAMVILSHVPKNAKRTVCWVGKGIVYDTGGLSLKISGNMSGMKADMAGAAAMLGAFQAAVETGAKDALHLILCLAENAIGPDATRPDDILYMYSGKTVEVNNTDAEGRLVLADGVAYANKDLKADVIVDMATLTGAQLVATGLRHAGIVCNDDDLEAQAIQAGKSSGDLVHPLPYCPEFFRREFKSQVADMRNSVKNRGNAQSSCAGQFVANHLGDFDGKWLHVDIAGPAGIRDRATGYGAALLLELFV